MVALSLYLSLSLSHSPLLSNLENWDVFCLYLPINLKINIIKNEKSRHPRPITLSFLWYFFIFFLELTNNPQMRRGQSNIECGHVRGESDARSEKWRKQRRSGREKGKIGGSWDNCGEKSLRTQNVSIFVLAVLEDENRHLSRAPQRRLDSFG